MFAVIETKGATHILINIPLEGADKSLPQLAAMLENNATFVNKGWREMTTVKPSSSFILGDTFRVDGEDAELVVKASGSVLTDDFVIATPEVFVSNKQAIDKRDKQITSLKEELAGVKAQLRRAQEVIEATEADI